MLGTCLGLHTINIYTRQYSLGLSTINNYTRHQPGTTRYYYLSRYLAGLVAQSVMSATDTLGHWDVHGLSAIDPCLRQWICVCTMPKDVGMLL